MKGEALGKKIEHSVRVEQSTEQAPRKRGGIEALMIPNLQDKQTGRWLTVGGRKGM